MIERAGSGGFDLELHGGSGRTGIQWYFREETRFPVAVQRWVLVPGGSEGAHTHPEGADALEEMYILVEGTAVMRVGESEYTMEPGDAVLAPAGVHHDLVNPGSVPATVLVVWGPPGPALDWSRYRTGRAARDAAQTPARVPAGRPDPPTARSATSSAGALDSLEITISTADVSRLAAFWAEALTYRILYHRDPYIVLGPAAGDGPRLVIQSTTSPTPAGGLHLDLRVGRPEETVARLVRHGASVRHRVAEAGKEWIVMTDPDGNEFCVCPARTG